MMTEEKKAAPPAEEPAPDQKLSGAEKRALAARSNAFNDMSKALVKINQQTLGVAIDPTGKFMVFANAQAVSEVLNGMVQTIRQLECSLSALADLVLSEKHVQAVPFPDTDPNDEKAAPMLGPSKITREEYWLRVAALAEHHASTLNRGLLSAGAGAAVSRILKPN
jgi:hypothetical protein